eukprot:9318255-Pyramimonas_sp.AAC.1
MTPQEGLGGCRGGEPGVVFRKQSHTSCSSTSQNSTPGTHSGERGTEPGSLFANGHTLRALRPPRTPFPGQFLDAWSQL